MSPFWIDIKCWVLVEPLHKMFEGWCLSSGDLFARLSVDDGHILLTSNIRQLKFGGIESCSSSAGTSTLLETSATRPRLDQTDARELNTTADTECNLTMTYETDHHNTYDYCDAADNISAQSEGGCRNHCCSSTGYRIAALNQNGTPHAMAKRG